MIWNDEILFIHVPKTGGMMMTDVLIKKLHKPLYYSVPPGHANLDRDDVIVVDGTRHEFLDEADPVLQKYGKSVRDFRFILTAMRNPYDMEVSRFGYLRNGYLHDKGSAQDLALKGDFDEFIEKSTFHGRTDPQLHRYYTIRGEIPDNLVVLRYENLESDFGEFLRKLNVEPGRFPKINASKHSKYTSYLSAKTEQIIFDKHRWFFEHGYYKRWKPDFLHSLKKYIRKIL